MRRNGRIVGGLINGRNGKLNGRGGLLNSRDAASSLPTYGLAVHFDAVAGITSAGGFASQWDDLSGNGRNLLQATGANQPIHLPYSGTKYGWLPGVAGNYFSTPDSVAASITGDIDIRVKAALNDWTPAIGNILVAKRNSSGVQTSYVFYVLSGGGFGFLMSTDGTATENKNSTITTSAFNDGSAGYCRVTKSTSTGDVKFYTSSDGTTWTQYGATVSGSAVPIYDGTSIVELGVQLSGTSSMLAGKIYSAQIYNGIDGTLAVDFDPSRWTSGATFTASTGETWTINSTGSKPAQIVDRASLLFDGAAHYMKTAPFTLNQPETVYLVAKQISWTINEYLCDGNSVNTGAIFQQTATPQLGSYAGSFGPTSTALAIGAAGVIAVTFNGASSTMQVNGGSVATGDVGAGNMGGFTLGCAGNGLVPTNIQVYEALIYNVAHNAATRANVIRALMSKHGVT